MNRAELIAQYREPRVAFIEEDLCIGCTKCITACPFDTIVGAAKLMHTVIESECTGCGLCVPACPMDCIAMLPVQRAPEKQDATVASWMQRQQNHEQRVLRDAQEKSIDYERTRLVEAQQEKMNAKKQAIAEAIARVKAKRLPPP
jgi:electron transport complex protein RnfB